MYEWVDMLSGAVSDFKRLAEKNKKIIVWKKNTKAY